VQTAGTTYGARRLARRLLANDALTPTAPVATGGPRRSLLDLAWADTQLVKGGVPMRDGGFLVNSSLLAGRANSGMYPHGAYVVKVIAEDIQGAVGDSVAGALSQLVRRTVAPACQPNDRGVVCSEVSHRNSDQSWLLSKCTLKCLTRSHMRCRALPSCLATGDTAAATGL
jgi:hypothetical protein